MFVEIINRIRPQLPSKLDSKLRWLWFFLQRLERGFDDSELSSLDHTIALFILPRLKALLDRKSVVHVVSDEWLTNMNEVVWLFEQYENDKFYSMGFEDSERAMKAMDIFAKSFFRLWW